MRLAREPRHLIPVTLSLAVLLFAALACSPSSVETQRAPASIPTPSLTHTPSDPGGGFPTAPAATSAPTRTPTLPNTERFVTLADCPITTVTTPYIARPPYLAQPPNNYKAAWHGNDELWTMLDPGGEVWAELPNNGGKLAQKTWWWSRSFEIELERMPAITVTGTRLDAPGSFTAGNPGTQAYADFGKAMLVGVEIPSTGCWEIRASYKGAELAYVALVE